MDQSGTDVGHPSSKACAGRYAGAQVAVVPATGPAALMGDLIDKAETECKDSPQKSESKTRGSQDASSQVFGD